MKLFFLITQSHIIAQWRHSSAIAYALGLMSLLVLVFTLALPQELIIAQEMRRAVLLLVMLVFSSITLNHFFIRDYRDGSLMQMLLSGTHPAVIVAAKLCAYWISFTLPFLLFVLPLILLLGIEVKNGWLFASAIALTSMVLAIIGAIIAALTMRFAEKTASAAPVIALPLYIPPLIVSSMILNNQTQHMTILLALIGFFLPLCLCIGALSIKGT